MTAIYNNPKIRAAVDSLSAPHQVLCTPHLGTLRVCIAPVNMYDALVAFPASNLSVALVRGTTIVVRRTFFQNSISSIFFGFSSCLEPPKHLDPSWGDFALIFRRVWLFNFTSHLANLNSTYSSFKYQKFTKRKRNEYKML
mgnify:CR=1 FL=1